MFKKSNKEPQLDAFSNVPTLLENTSCKQYSDRAHWHNQFREQVLMRFDESVFSVLFSNTTGAPNAPVRILIGMMILKEAFVWSDSQLFEQCRFNLLVRSALGLFNMNDPLPVESTYYLLRKRMYDHQKQTGEDLMGKVFVQITSGQARDFEVNGHSIRMDSKLIGSNIAMFSRYEIIHQTVCRFYKSMDKSLKTRLMPTDLGQMEELLREEPQKTVYRSSREEIKSRLQPIGLLAHTLLKSYRDVRTEAFELLVRVFHEQYKVTGEDKVELRPKEEISSGSVQSPDDPDCAYRNKGGQKVKGYSMNVAETSPDDNLSLITSVLVEKANAPDTVFVEPAIQDTMEITGQLVEKVYLDGAFQSPSNDSFCAGIDMVFSGIQGAEPRYDLEMTTKGLMVTDTQTGQNYKAVFVKRQKRSTEDRWRIITPNGYHYFNQQAIRTSQLRREIKARPIEEQQKRNNVEATIFLLGIPLRNGKSKYRGLIRQKAWAFCRCLWINLVRIMNFMGQTGEKMVQETKMQAQNTFFCPFLCLLAFLKQIIPILFSKEHNPICFSYEKIT